MLSKHPIIDSDKTYMQMALDLAQEAYRAEEVPVDEPMFLVCGSGARSYEAQLLLSKNGIKNTKNVQGGMGMIKASNPDFAKAATPRPE